MPTLLNFSAKNTRLAIVAIVAIVAETFNPSFVYNIRQICQSYFLFIPHSHSPSSTPPQRSQTRNKTNANGHQIVHSYQLRRLFGRNGRNGQIARGGCVDYEVVWTLMKLKICLYSWGVFGPWRGSVASYATDERAKNDQKERWRLNVEEFKLQIKSSSEKFRRLQYGEMRFQGDFCVAFRPSQNFFQKNQFFL